jgi:MarR family transcriptional regulator for hemolysin
MGMLLVGVARRWRRVLDDRLADVGLSDATWAPLLHLHSAGTGLRQKDLAERVGVDGSTLVRLLDILAQRGMIERQSDGTDKRANLIVLTDAGSLAVEEIKRRVEPAEQEILADLSDRQISELAKILHRIDGRIEVIGKSSGKER